MSELLDRSIYGELWAAKVASHAAFKSYLEHMPGVLERRCEAERLLWPLPGEAHYVTGYCAVCRRTTRYLVDYKYSYLVDGVPHPNLRERLECEFCNLNSRMRASLHFLIDRAPIGSHKCIYTTERLTPLYRALQERYPNVIGSEFLRDGTQKGAMNSDGIRHEDCTALSFASMKFDFILSLEVIEHIFDYKAALREMCRCLKVGGTLLLTAPFVADSEGHVERARIVDGVIEHLLEPEYHGDPLNAGGVLSFRTYGWNLINDLKDAGFADASVYFYWSRRLGYLGGLLSIVMATR